MDTSQPFLSKFVHSPDHFPDFLEALDKHTSKEQRSSIYAHFCEHPVHQKEFTKAIRSSLFVCNAFARKPENILFLLSTMRLSESLNKEQMRNIVGTMPSDDPIQFDTKLREWRQLFMLRIIWRTLNRIASLNDTMRELSDLAEIAIETCLTFHSSKLKSRYGCPRNNNEEEQGLFVIGMGKLGARELNVSSDIDLIFCYPDQGYTDGKKTIENQEFFTQIGKRVIQSLSEITSDGFVFRLDMRLRPYGTSGPIVSHFSALESYYHSQGREWERYAMIKARVVACSCDTQHSKRQEIRKQELQIILQQFAYRKYIDFSVIDALRKMKLLIEQEVRRRKLDDDLKLGSGGIREIEFIAQVFQLIRGGRDLALQDNRLSVIYPLLVAHSLMPQDSVEALLEAYTFLRHTEHAIQAFKDEQTQALPHDALAQKALLTAMDFEHWHELIEKLNAHRQRVHREFQALIRTPEKQESDTPDCNTLNSDTKSALSEYWQLLCKLNNCNLDSHANSDIKLSFSKEEIPLSSDADKVLREFARSPVIRQLNGESQIRMDRFMPLLLNQLLLDQLPPNSEQQARILERVFPIIRAIARRSAYLALLIENNHALKQLLWLTQSSPYIAEQLTKYPALLDELLDKNQLQTLPQKNELKHALQQQLLRIEESDLEAQMEALRYFKLSHRLRIMACELNGKIPLMKVSDYLSHLAEVLVEYCLNLAWNTMTRTHGFPDGAKSDEPDLLVVAYGKLGSMEMNHNSDLDLVFMHQSSITGHTNGKRRMDNQAFYLRLGQKLVHLLNTQTSNGRLYEVDMRLRPSGNSGLLATSFKAFQKYQENEAWTWEHQALVRARPIAGPSELAAEFKTLRTKILQQRRDPHKLAEDIVEMRAKMHGHLSQKPQELNVFDLKQDRGGIVDIEFMVQYLVLAWSYEKPALATYTDNIRILETLAHTGKLSTQEVHQLISAYKALRVVLHRQTIEQKNNQVKIDELKKERESVITVWNRLFKQAIQ